MRKCGLPLAVVGIAVGLLFVPLISGGLVLSGHDIVNQYLPYKQLWKQEILSGRLPWWNPSIFGGRPHLADVQLGTFYPPNWILLILPLPLGFSLLAALHMIWGGWGMTRFLERLGLNVEATLLGGVLWALAGYHSSRLFPGIVLFLFTASWVPWALVALWAIETGRVKHGAIALGFILTMQLFSGAPQVLYITLVFIGLIFALRIGVETWTGRDASHSGNEFAVGAATWLPLSRRWGAALGGAAVLLLIMGSPQWPATLEFSALTVERAEGASYGYATDGSVALRYLWLNVVPEIFGPLGSEEIYWGGREGFWEISSWMGLVAPTLALLALVLLSGHWVSARRESVEGYFWRIQTSDSRTAGPRGNGSVSAFSLTPAHQLFLAAFFLAWMLGWLLALGVNSPLYLVSYYVLPFLNRFRVPGRFLLFHALAVSVFAPLLLHLLMMPKDAATEHWERRLVVGVTMLCVVLYLIVGIGLNPVLNALGMPAGGAMASIQEQLRMIARLSWLRSAVPLAIAAGVVTLSLRRPPVKRSPACMAVSALCAFELLAYGWQTTSAQKPSSITDREYAKSEVVQFLAGRNELGRFLCLDSVYDWRHDQNQMELFPNRPMIHGLFDARGYDPLYLATYAQAISLAAGLPAAGSKGAFLFVPEIVRPAILSLLNVRTVLTYDELGPPFEELRAFMFADGSRLIAYDNPQAAGWAWLSGVDKRPVEPLLSLMAARPERAGSLALMEPGDWDKLRDSLPASDWAAMCPAENEGWAVERADRGSVQVTVRRPGCYEIQADVQSASLLVVAENMYPGWRATMDGRPVEIYRVNLTQIGVPVARGKHQVTLKFADQRLVASIIAAILTAIIALLVLKSRLFERSGW